ncbi:MerR family DNA-binding protein [Microcoleus sp. w1-18aA5]|uniref:MerR family DNA-binding protein n=1 Tax=unclassified Microcoleus TaxID=2642155 RepID=UPI002FCFA0DC
MNPSPQWTEAGDRLFSRQDMERLAFISSAKSLGRSLEEIKEIIALEDGQLLACKVVDDRLNKKVQAIEDNIRQLRSLHDELVPLVEQGQTKLEQSDPTYQCLVLEK